MFVELFVAECIAQEPRQQRLLSLHRLQRDMAMLIEHTRLVRLCSHSYVLPCDNHVARSYCVCAWVTCVHVHIVTVVYKHALYIHTYVHTNIVSVSARAGSRMRL